MENEEKVEKLKKFNELISDYFDGNYENIKEIKKEINYLTPLIHELVAKAGCNKRMTISPPPAVGGMVLNNINPFDMVFDEPYGISLIPKIIDIVDQAIGNYKNNLVKEPIVKKENKEYLDNYPKKITFSWLLNHVPMKIWLAGVALLIGSFTLGFKFCQLFIK